MIRFSRIWLILLLFLLQGAWVLKGYAQQSIHQEEQFWYKNHVFSDNLESYSRKVSLPEDSCTLEKMVFGYHPYWVGSVWKQYNWNLLSDLCYFSYEVDPGSGNPLTLNGWETAEVIDSALENGTRVHLCVTLFSSHASFLQNPAAGQTLINNLIDLLQTRHAHGVNIDFEAVPSSQAILYNNYLVSLADSLHSAIPGCIVSMASPAVDWSGMLNIPLLSAHLDYFMIMGYDYYWNSSEQAGPVAGQFPMTSSYPYSVSSTLAWYLSKGAAPDNLLLGVPYYGRDWPVSGPTAPSGIRAGGTALTYRNYRINNSLYSYNNRRFEPNSRSYYYSYSNNGWNQCFIDDTWSLGNKYELVKRFGIAGIGIWALGYDNGYSDLWELIKQKFTWCSIPLCSDTVYDSGGPSFDYPGGESYTQVIRTREGELLNLEFLDFEVDETSDTLTIYEGNSSSLNLLGRFTGKQSPGTITTQSGQLRLDFSSDSGSLKKGWKAVYACPSAGIKEIFSSDSPLVFPNPCKDHFNLVYEARQGSKVDIQISDLSGKWIAGWCGQAAHTGQNNWNSGEAGIFLTEQGVYIGKIAVHNGDSYAFKILKY